MIDGFTYVGSCNCGGVRNVKYQKGKYIVYYIKKGNRYHLKEKNNYLVKNQPITTLCERLKSLGLVDSADCLSTN